MAKAEQKAPSKAQLRRELWQAKIQAERRYNRAIEALKVAIHNGPLIEDAVEVVEAAVAELNRLRSEKGEPPPAPVVVDEQTAAMRREREAEWLHKHSMRSQAREIVGSVSVEPELRASMFLSGEHLARYQERVRRAELAYYAVAKPARAALIADLTTPAHKLVASFQERIGDSGERYRAAVRKAFLDAFREQEGL